MEAKRVIGAPRHILSALALLLLAGGAALKPPAARADGAGVPPDEVLASDAKDSIAVLISARDPEAIRKDLEAAHAAELDAQTDSKKAGDLAELLKARIQVKKGEIDALKGKAKLAKEQQNEADQKGYEAEQSAQELQRDLLEAFRDLRSAEKDAADARAEAARARARFFERELEFGAKLSEASRLHGDAATPPEKLVVADAGVQATQKQALQALKDMADRAQDADKARGNSVDRRLKVYDLQMQIAAPKK